MKKYDVLVTAILDNIGGNENIIAVTHCATRLRFQLSDEKKVNDDAIREIKEVVTVVKSNGQYQIVIGTYVADVYDELMCKISPKDTEKVVAKSETKKSIGGVLLEYMTSIMGPLLSLMCGAGILKGVVALLSMLGMSQTETLYLILNAASDAAYFYMPILIGYTFSKKLGMNPVIGIVLAGAMVYPSTQNMEAASLLGIDISGISYTSTMFPIVFVLLAAAPLDKFLKRILPQSVSSFMEPALLLLLIVTPLAYLVIGPVSTMISNGLGGIISNVYNASPMIGGFLLCALWQILVLFGIHMGLAVVIFTAMFAVGTSALYPLTCIPAFTQLAITLAVYLKTKDRKVKDVALPASLSALFGTTEPAIYGISLPTPKLFVMSCLVSGAVGAFMGAKNVLAYQLGGNGILSLTIVMAAGETANLINYIIAITAATVISFILTMFLYRPQKDNITMNM